MTHPELKGAADIAKKKFISLILEFWNIVNVHNAGLDLRTLNPVRSVIRTREDNNLKKLSQMAELADRMYPRDNPRVKTLTRDTATALSDTRRGLMRSY